ETSRCRRLVGSCGDRKVGRSSCADDVALARCCHLDSIDAFAAMASQECGEDRCSTVRAHLRDEPMVASAQRALKGRWCCRKIRGGRFAGHKGMTGVVERDIPGLVKARAA